MVEHLDGGEKPGARGSSIGFSTSDLGELEHLEYTEAMAPEEQPGFWRKVLIHSLAIRTDIYRELGGFPAQYGDFAIWALAITLTEAGHELDYTPEPAVRHAYTGELGILADHARDFSHGEMEYCASVPGSLRARYLDENGDWTERFAFTRAGALRALRDGVAGRRRSSALARHALTALAGPRATVALRCARAQVLRLRVHAGRGTGARRRAVYRAYWAACQSQGRVEWLARNRDWLPAAPQRRAGRPLRTRRAQAGRPVHGGGVGGPPFPLDGAACRLGGVLPEGPLEGRLEVLPIRPAKPQAAPAVAVDGGGSLAGPTTGASASRSRAAAFAGSGCPPSRSGPSGAASAYRSASSPSSPVSARSRAARRGSPTARARSARRSRAARSGRSRAAARSRPARGRGARGRRSGRPAIGSQSSPQADQ